MNSYENGTNNTFNTEHNKVGIYCRVSTQDQAREGFSLGEQEERLKALCTYKGYKIVDIYIDGGLSAKNTNRPEYQRLMNDIKIGKINRIVAFKLDRITRSIVDLEKLVKYLEEQNCSLECACEEINTSNANGRFFVRMLTILAQLELERTSERTSIGLAGALKAKHIGQCPIGYKKENKCLIINEETAPIIKRIFYDYINGKSTCQIAKDFNNENILNKKWKDNTIGQILQNRIYIGEYVEHKVVPNKPQVIHYDMAPMIISREVFNKAQEQREKNSHSRYVKRTYIFHKKINCPICNNVFSCICGTSKLGTTYLYYKCKHCKPTYSIGEKEIEKEFLKCINELLDYYAILDNSFITIHNIDYFKEISIIKKEIKEIDDKIENAKMLILDNKITPNEMRSVIDKLEQNKRIKQLELSDLIVKNDNLISIDNDNYYNQIRDNDYSIISQYVSNNQLWYKLSNEQKYTIINKYIENVEIELTKDKKIIVKKINIKENKVVDFGISFRYDIYNLLNDN